jgi:hypothetical protein
MRAVPSCPSEPPPCFRAIRFVKQVGPAQLFDLPFEGEFSQSSFNQPTGDREDVILREDRFRRSDRAEIVDEADPHERVKATRTDYGDQISTAKLELTFQGGFVYRRRHSRAAAAARDRRWTWRSNMKGPAAGTAVGDLDSRVRSPFRIALRVHLLTTEIYAQWLTTAWTDWAAGPAVIGLDWHAPLSQNAADSVSARVDK